MSAYRYELGANGAVIARYRTLGQALLGAVWRSKRLGATVYVYKANDKRGAIIAAIDTAQ